MCARDQLRVRAHAEEQREQRVHVAVAIVQRAHRIDKLELQLPLHSTRADSVTAAAFAVSDVGLSPSLKRRVFRIRRRTRLCGDFVACGRQVLLKQWEERGDARRG